MKHFLSVLVAIIVGGVLAASIALADHKRATFTFDTSVMVNGTLVKPDTYQLVFDNKTNQLAIKKEGKTIVTAAAHLEQRDAKAEQTEVLTLQNGDTSILTGVRFAGQRQEVVIANTVSVK